MGDRAVITTVGARKNDIGVYLHWNGSLEEVEAFLTYCDLKGFRLPETDSYGFAYLCTVIGNFIGDGLSLGVEKISHLDTDNYDNGVYYIEDWKIVSRSYENEPTETNKKELYSCLKCINECQGEKIKVSEDEIKKYCKEHNIPLEE